MYFGGSQENLSVLAQARSQAHPNVLEALFIQAVFSEKKIYYEFCHFFSLAMSGIVSGRFWSLVPGGGGCYRFCLVIII